MRSSGFEDRHSGDEGSEEERQEQQNLFIFRRMDPSAAESFLLSRFVDNPDLPAAWLIRESREPGMVTVQCITREQAEAGRNAGGPETRCYRFCLTDEGWVSANFSPRSRSFNQVRQRMQNAVNVENASQHVQSLLVRVMEEQAVSLQEQVVPDKKHQAQDRIYCGYTNFEQSNLTRSFDSGELTLSQSREGRGDLVCSGAGLMRSQDLMLSGSMDSQEPPIQRRALSESMRMFRQKQERPREAIVNISIPELDRLIRDPITNDIMQDPVTDVRSGVTYDRSTLQQDQRMQNWQEGRDFYPNHTLKSIIRYVVAVFAENVDPEVKLAKLESLERELTDIVSLDALNDPVLLRTGHCIERESLNGMIRSGRTLRDPSTNVPITAGEEITAPTVRSVAALLPQIQEQVRENIAQQRSGEAPEEKKDTNILRKSRE